MAVEELALMAHLFRRAGFGASRDVLEAYVAKGYEETVDELLAPLDHPGFDEDIMYRHWPSFVDNGTLEDNQAQWVFRMVNDPRQLREKVALFWHTILCVGYSKVESPPQMGMHINMFRERGMGNVKDILLRLSRDPAMVYYLDNCESHKNAVNENYGRELLELFSIGVGKDGEFNYTEDDVKACARAFTGWNLGNSVPVFPYGLVPWKFVYDPADHDDTEKTFLGKTGHWNGEDVIDIICKQPAAARFISRKMYDFFVADEPAVPTWRDTEPRDMDAIKMLEKVYFDSGYEVTPMLRTLFNSEFFKAKAVRFAKVKSPAEMVAGILRMTGDYREPDPWLLEPAWQTGYMGMDLMNPPTVEGWHTGREWIDGGTLVERINFAADQMGNTGLPGVQDMINRLRAFGETLTAEQFVDGCLDLVGPLEVLESTRQNLLEFAREEGELRHKSDQERTEFDRRTGEMLQMIGATGEFQFG